MEETRLYYSSETVEWSIGSSPPIELESNPSLSAGTFHGPWYQKLGPLLPHT